MGVDKEKIFHLQCSIYWSLLRQLLFLSSSTLIQIVSACMGDFASGRLTAPTEDGRESSCCLTYSTLPKITMIDLPFFASTTESAFSTLGGIELIKNLVRDGAKNISLKFPSSNALQGSIVGEKISTGGGLLLKVRRRKERPMTDLLSAPCEKNVQITALGRIDSMYVFNQPTDYQVHIYS